MNKPGSVNYQRLPRRNIMVVKPKKRAPSNKTLNKKINNVKNNLIELKPQDVFNNGSLIPNTGLLINGMNFTSTRSGNEINASSLSIKAQITTDVDTLSATIVRVIVFWDRQVNGADAILAGDNGLLQNATVTNLTVAPRNYLTIDRYKILDDWCFSINPRVVLDFDTVTGTTTTVLTYTEVFSRYYKLSRMMKYDAASNNITSNVTNTINVALFSDSAANQPTIISGTRLYFKD